MHAVPRFLWNAKMRFGKTFTSYQLAKKLGATRVLVVTFKPAVEDAWQTDLENHADFDGWQYMSKQSGADPTVRREGQAARLLRLLPRPPGPRQGRQHQGQEPVAPRDQLGLGGLRRVPLRRVARHGQGALRGRGRRCRQEGAADRVLRRPRGGQRGPGRAVRARDRVPAHHHPRLPLPLGHALQGASHGRVHRRADLQLDLHRRAAGQGGLRQGAPRQVEPLRRAPADAAADLPDARRAAGHREQW